MIIDMGQNNGIYGWILLFPTSRLPPWWGILMSRYINIAHPGNNTFSNMHAPIMHSERSKIIDLVSHFWDQLNTSKRWRILPTLSHHHDYSIFYLPDKGRRKKKRKIFGERGYIFVEEKEKEKTFFAEENNNGEGTWGKYLENAFLWRRKKRKR